MNYYKCRENSMHVGTTKERRKEGRKEKEEKGEGRKKKEKEKEKKEGRTKY